MSPTSMDMCSYTDMEKRCWGCARYIPPRTQTSILARRIEDNGLLCPECFMLVELDDTWILQQYWSKCAFCKKGNPDHFSTCGTYEFGGTGFVGLGHSLHMSCRGDSKECPTCIKTFTAYYPILSKCPPGTVRLRLIEDIETSYPWSLFSPDRGVHAPASVQSSDNTVSTPVDAPATPPPHHSSKGSHGPAFPKLSESRSSSKRRSSSAHRSSSKRRSSLAFPVYSPGSPRPYPRGQENPFHIAATYGTWARSELG
ncbi:uncharacterized protein B0J16DRAFT_166197 [Fusarium flagelliforme]|uniref:uncharacterized protein n=1 Tax=Fusarium flagelliforme TaxID=2675880 RepID=UPI001E8E69E2|nr:uncharacterized protein B0J16DRAFT_166197 [Fusarium flagelliforme]KAH7178989.1 hypothetical protein B0J16DRAFT_166197 [Fusarium flagelliforme]